MLDRKDGGMASRKMWLAIMAMAGCFLTGLVVGKVPAMAPHIDAIIGGYVAVLLVYTGGNVGAKVAIGKYLPQADTDDDEKPEKAPAKLAKPSAAKPTKKDEEEGS